MSIATVQINSQLRPATKVVIRLLPPTLTENALIKTIGEEFQRSATWINFVPGKRRKASAARVSVNSRAYINFANPQLAESFCKAFHGHSFVDEKGEVFRAVVCLAPYQKVPKCEVVADKKSNTMETDPLYLEFLQLESDPKPIVAHPPTEIAPSDGVTSLVKYVQEKHRLHEEQAAERKRKTREYTKAAKRCQVTMMTKSFEGAATKPKRPSRSSKKGEAPIKSEKRRKGRGRRREGYEEKEFSKKAAEQRPASTPLKILERPTNGKSGMKFPQREKSDRQKELQASSQSAMAAGTSSKPAVVKSAYRPRRPKFADLKRDDQYKHHSSGRGRGRKEEGGVWRPTILRNLNNSNSSSGINNRGDPPSESQEGG